MRNCKNKTDAELMALVSRADETAFAELYDRYERSVYSLVFFKLKNESDAEDVTEEVFIKLWQRASAYAERGSVGAYIMTVAKNAATDHLRKKQDTLSLTLEAEDGSTNGGREERELADTSNGPEDEVLRLERIEAVRSAIGSLPEHHSEVITLCDINEMSYRDAADVLSVDIGTVKSRLSRARRALRELLKDFYFQGNKTDTNSVNINEDGEKKEGGTRK